MEQQQDFTTSILVDQSPAEVFSAINHVGGWWQGEVKGNSEKLGDEFTYQMKTFHYSKQKVAELIQDKKIVWLVTDSNLSFVKNTSEWTGTSIEFITMPENGGTRITFTHHGLVPAFECYGGCSNGWDQLIHKSLYSYITTGKGVDVF